MVRYVFVTGGVVSSLGKGIASASLAAVLETRGLKVTLLKLDPYLNVDPGTMNPYQHGEVFVTEDGAETDLDLGHYERFSRIKMTRANNFTAGRVYEKVIQRERRGEYGGGTVQVIPHVTDEIKRSIIEGAGEVDIAILEIGGTVGDIESLPFLEAIRQMRIELGSSRTLFIHLTLVPFIPTSGEIKTKPTQHSVKELRSIGIQPDILVCRSAIPLTEPLRTKIAMFTNVEQQGIISLVDVESIYQVPLELHSQGLDDLVIEKLRLHAKPAHLRDWEEVVHAKKNPLHEINIAIVGKYGSVPDSYKSLIEALHHAGIKTRTHINIDYIDSEELEKTGTKLLVGKAGILVPGGFGKRGIEGKILAARYARENKIPYLGICLGMQVAIIEYARHVCHMAEAHSTEFEPDTPYPVIALIEEWTHADGKVRKAGKSITIGGSLRLGGQEAHLLSNSLVQKIYGKPVIIERHRHRYEVNHSLVTTLEKNDLVISGRSADKSLVEMIELKEHPWFIGCQFHPEFTSTPREGHPLFNAFIEASMHYKNRPVMGVDTKSKNKV